LSEYLGQIDHTAPGGGAARRRLAAFAHHAGKIRHAAAPRPPTSLLSGMLELRLRSVSVRWIVSDGAGLTRSPFVVSAGPGLTRHRGVARRRQGRLA